MNAKELRIGNLINYLGEPTVVASISQSEEKEELSYISTQKSGINTNFSYRPISLSEEWLLKFGFDYTDDGENEYMSLIRGHHTKIISSDYSVKFSKVWLHTEIPYTKREYLYVHQLQNLYFELTGEELTFKI